MKTYHASPSIPPLALWASCSQTHSGRTQIFGSVLSFNWQRDGKYDETRGLVSLHNTMLISQSSSFVHSCQTRSLIISCCHHLRQQPFSTRALVYPIFTFSIVINTYWCDSCLSSSPCTDWPHSSLHWPHRGLGCNRGDLAHCYWGHTPFNHKLSLYSLSPSAKT